MINRREFLSATLGAAAVLPFLSGFRASPSVPFQHGVASGDPLTDRVILWTRVTPHVQGGTALVAWIMTHDPERRQVVQWGLTMAGPQRDYTIQVEPRGLRPGTTYYY